MTPTVGWFSVFSQDLDSCIVSSQALILLFLNKVCDTRTEECMLAGHIPNPIGLYCTLKESKSHLSTSTSAVIE